MTADADADANADEGGATPERRDAGGLAPVTKSSLLWGVVGALSFLVLAQGYELLGSATISVPVKVGVALVVAAAAAASTYALQRRVPTENESS